jgi:hypothetical protein
MGIQKTTPNIVTDGLLLYFDAGNRISYPGTGSTWNDLSGRGVQATLAAASPGVAPVWNPKNQGVLVYDGVGSYVSVASTTQYNFVGAPFTFTGWWLRRSSQAYIFTRTAAVGSGNPSTYTFGTTTTGQTRIVLYDNTGANQSVKTVNTALPSGSAWSHIAVTYTGTGTTTNVRLYENGVEATNTTITSAGTFTALRASTTPLYIGSFAPAGTYKSTVSDMDLAIVQMYTKVLSAQEIAQNYNAHKSRFGLN